MRTFIAIELPQEIKDRLAKLQEQLKTSGADVKWVEPTNIHLTLKFLGEVDEKRIGEINSLIKDTANIKSAFHIKICSIGVFPKMHYPRVIWVGTMLGDKETKEIAKELENSLAKIGIPKEKRPFSSHITIGRTRSLLHKESLVQELKKIADKIEAENLEFNVDKITLFKSTLTPKGPVYEALKETSLKTN